MCMTTNLLHSLPNSLLANLIAASLQQKLNVINTHGGGICPALYKLLCLCFADPGGNKDGAHQFRFTETETRGSSVNRLNVYG